MQIRVIKAKKDSIDIFIITELYASIILLTLLYSCSSVDTNSNAIEMTGCCLSQVTKKHI